MKSKYISFFFFVISIMVYNNLNYQAMKKMRIIKKLDAMRILRKIKQPITQVVQIIKP